MHSCVRNQVTAYPAEQSLFTALPQAQTVDDYEALLPWNLLVTDRTVNQLTSEF